MSGGKASLGQADLQLMHSLEQGSRRWVVCPACCQVQLSCGAREEHLDFVRECMCVWGARKPAFSDRGLCTKTLDAGDLRSFWMGCSCLGMMEITAGPAFGLPEHDLSDRDTLSIPIAIASAIVSISRLI